MGPVHLQAGLDTRTSVFGPVQSPVCEGQDRTADSLVPDIQVSAPEAGATEPVTLSPVLIPEVQSAREHCLDVVQVRERGNTGAVPAG